MDPNPTKPAAARDSGEPLPVEWRPERFGSGGRRLLFLLFIIFLELLL
jgi:hypothetical protein